MLKRMLSKKIMITTSALFALFLIYLVPKDGTYTLDPKKVPSQVSYVDMQVNTEEVYLLNNHNMLSRTKIASTASSNNVEARAKVALESLIKEGPNSNKLPNGFRALLPNETKLVSLNFENGLLKINFSKELLDVKADEEEQVVEAIVYTATAIPEVKNIILYVDNEVLTLLSQSKTSLPASLNRSFGINKEYDFTKTKDINQVTVYYVDHYNDSTYYVPVTKYLNDDRDKVKIIIDQLTSTNAYNSNLMSYLNSNTRILDIKTAGDIMELDFNSSIFDDQEDNNILEEVIYTVSLSIKDNYDVSEVVFKVQDEEIYKSVLKTIE